MINPIDIKVIDNKAKFIYNNKGCGKILSKIHTVLDVSDPNSPKAVKSFVDEYTAQDYADEYYFKENHDCIVVPSSLNVSLDETNY